MNMVVPLRPCSSCENSVPTVLFSNLDIVRRIDGIRQLLLKNVGRQWEKPKSWLKGTATASPLISRIIFSKILTELRSTSDVIDKMYDISEIEQLCGQKMFRWFSLRFRVARVSTAQEEQASNTFGDSNSFWEVRSRNVPQFESWGRELGENEIIRIVAPFTSENLPPFVWWESASSEMWPRIAIFNISKTVRIRPSLCEFQVALFCTQLDS